MSIRAIRGSISAPSSTPHGLLGLVDSSLGERDPSPKPKAPAAVIGPAPPDPSSATPDPTPTAPARL